MMVHGFYITFYWKRHHSQTTTPVKKIHQTYIDVEFDSGRAQLVRIGCKSIFHAVLVSGSAQTSLYYRKHSTYHQMPVPGHFRTLVRHKVLIFGQF